MSHNVDVELRSLHYAMGDFSEAHSAAHMLQSDLYGNDQYDLPTRRRMRCFETTLIIAYCRPFTHSAGRKRLTFELIGYEPEEDERALHEKLIFLRNKVIAHGQVSETPMSLHSIDFEDFQARIPEFYTALWLNDEEIGIVSQLLPKLSSCTVRKALAVDLKRDAE